MTDPQYHENGLLGTLHLLPTGHGTLIRRNKFGFWVLIDGNKIFIRYSETLNESIFETVPLEDEDNND